MGISPALESKLQDLEQRKIDAEITLGSARRPVAIPNRSEVHEIWTELVEGLGELPKKMTDTEVETARTAIKGILGEIRVTRDGQGYADVCLQSMVAGARLSNYKCLGVEPFPLVLSGKTSRLGAVTPNRL